MTGKHEHPIPTRYSLLSRLGNWDDQQSWKDFFDTYWRLIYQVAVSAGLNDSEAQDVVQETVISVAKGIHTFKRDRTLGSFKGWLRNIIRWRIGDQLRKRLTAGVGANRALFAEAVALESIPDPAIPALDARWEQDWHENLLKAALNRVKTRVKEEHYQMFDLYALKKLPVSKVAEMFGVSTGVVYLAKHRVGGLVKKEIRNLEQNPF